MLPQPILVSDESYKDGNFIILPYSYEIRKCVNGTTFIEGSKKIIAGIPERYSITYSDEASKTLQERCGWVDVEKLVDELSEEQHYVHPSQQEWFEIGAYSTFRKVQSLNEKKFSEDEVEQMIRRYSELLLKAIEADENPTPESLPLPLDFIKSLSQPKVFDVEVEMEPNFEKNPEIYGTGMFNKGGFVPKITNNSIKLIKVL